METVAVAKAEEQPATSNANVEATTKETLQDVKRRYFSPADMPAGLAMHNKVVGLVKETKGAKLVYNFDADETFPEGYGLAIIPIQQRQEGKGDEPGYNLVIGVAIAAIPDPVTILAHDKGEKYVRDQIVDACCAKVANFVRPRKDGTTAGSIPFSVEDFIETKSGDEGLKTFTTLAPDFVKALRAKGLNFITVPLLRQTLQSAAFAGTVFAKLKQEQWQLVIAKMIEKAKSKNLDVSVLQNWAATRDQVSTDDVEEMDLGDLAA